MCIFCKIGEGSVPADLLYESEHVVAFRDLEPQAPVHILIIPKAHYENAAELAAAESFTLSELCTAAGTLAAELALTGYRLVFNTGTSAGQSVFHAHLHLLAGRSFAWPPG